MTAHFATCTTVDAADLACKVVLVPVGSCEQHGPHLPLLTDSLIAARIADVAAAERPGSVVVAPPVHYGASGEHQSFAGTVSIGQTALEALALELARSLADQCRTLVFVNGHGGNVAALDRAVATATHEGRRVVVWSPRPPRDPADSHAGRTETSLLLHIAPALVRAEMVIAGTSDPLADLMPRMIAGGVGAVSPNGVLGDPTGASSDEGRAMLASMVHDLLTAIDEALT